MISAGVREIYITALKMKCGIIHYYDDRDMNIMSSDVSVSCMWVCLAEDHNNASLILESETINKTPLLFSPHIGFGFVYAPRSGF